MIFASALDKLRKKNLVLGRVSSLSLALSWEEDMQVSDGDTPMSTAFLLLERDRKIVRASDFENKPDSTLIFCKYCDGRCTWTKAGHFRHLSGTTCLRANRRSAQHLIEACCEDRQIWLREWHACVVGDCLVRKSEEYISVRRPGVTTVVEFRLSPPLPDDLIRCRALSKSVIFVFQELKQRPLRGADSHDVPESFRKKLFLEVPEAVGSCRDEPFTVIVQAANLCLYVLRSGFSPLLVDSQLREVCEVEPYDGAELKDLLGEEYVDDAHPCILRWTREARYESVEARITSPEKEPTSREAVDPSITSAESLKVPEKHEKVRDSVNFEGRQLLMQILDADAVQIVAEAGWLSQLRAGRRSFDDETQTVDEKGLRDSRFGKSESDRKAGGYCVRIWGRTSDDKSIVLVVPDAVSTLHYLCRDVPQVKSVACALEQSFPHREGEVFPAVRCDVIRKHATNGWRPSSSGDGPALCSWLRVQVASTRIKNQIPSKLGFLDRKICGISSILSDDRTTAEQNVEIHAALLEETGLSPGGWVCLGENLARRARLSWKVSSSLCVQLSRSELSSCRGVDATCAPRSRVRVLSFDIECYSRSHQFPCPEKPEDQVITIGLVTRSLPRSKDESDRRLALVLDPDSSAERASARDLATSAEQLRFFRSELDLLQGLSSEVDASDADVIVGYNTCTFDWRYLVERLKVFSPDKSCPERRVALERAIFSLGRARGSACVPHTRQLTSSAMGDNPLCYPRTPGRFGLDLWLYLKKENLPQLTSLKLETVSQHFLGRGKHDLPPQKIFQSFEQGGEGRVVIAKYCIEDCALVLDLMERLSVLPRLLKMAEITYTTPENLNFRGQQIKVYSQLLRVAHRRGYLVADPPSRATVSEAAEEEGGVGFAGALVVAPDVGYYLDPVLTVDYASLYPSLIQTHNLSPETFTCFESPEAAGEGAHPRHFVGPEISKGLLPELLETLLGRRAEVRKQMASETSAERRSLLDAEQLALKISANSVYGACGSSSGPVSFLPVAQATTAAGREAIQFTRRFLEETFEGCRVIYGDTDSCFVRLSPSQRELSMPELFELGEHMAASATEAYASKLNCRCAVRLEFEKVLRPFVIYCKKRYAGLSYTSPTSTGKPIYRGLELVRRDAIPIVRSAEERILRSLLAGEDARRVADVAREAVISVLQLRPGGPFQDIVASKTLRANYKDPDSMAHKRVCELMDLRNPGSSPRVGDRVFFVVVASETSRIVDKVDDVTFAEQNRLPPDWLHYTEALERCLMRLLEVPLSSAAPDSLEEMRLYFLEAKRVALEQVRRHSLARNGAVWHWGHRDKKSGATQLKLNFVSSNAVAAASSSDSTGSPSEILKRGASSSVEFAESTKRHRTLAVRADKHDVSSSKTAHVQATLIQCWTDS